MFTDNTFLKFKIATKESLVGDLAVNSNLLKNYDFYHPFVRFNSPKEVVKYGNRNNEVIEQYIVKCLNDYYIKLTSTTDMVERPKMLDKYMHLYSMWRELYIYKNANDLVGINNMYDLFLYELYIMGYVA